MGARTHSADCAETIGTYPSRSTGRNSCADTSGDGGIAVTVGRSGLVECCSCSVCDGDFCNVYPIGNGISEDAEAAWYCSCDNELRLYKNCRVAANSSADAHSPGIRCCAGSDDHWVHPASCHPTGRLEELGRLEIASGPAA